MLFKLPLLQLRNSQSNHCLRDQLPLLLISNLLKHTFLSPRILPLAKHTGLSQGSTAQIQFRGVMACRRAVAKAMNQYAAMAAIQPSCLEDPGKMSKEEMPGFELSDSSHPSSCCSLSPTPSSARAVAAPNAAASEQKPTSPRRQRIRVSKVNGHVRLSVPLEPGHLKKKKGKEPAVRTLPVTCGSHHLSVIKKSGQTRLRIGRSKPLQTERRFKVFIFRNGVGRRVTRLTALHKS